MCPLEFVKLYPLDGTICLHYSHESMQVLRSRTCDSLSGGITSPIPKRKMLLYYLQAMSTVSTSGAAV